jgi:hypothetical protein
MLQFPGIIRASGCCNFLVQFVTSIAAGTSLLGNIQQIVHAPDLQRKKIILRNDLIMLLPN